MSVNQIKPISLKKRLNWSKPRVFNQASPIYPWIVFFVVTFISTCAAFTAFTTMITSSSIQGSLSLGNTEVVWSGVIFLLVVANMVPLSGKAAQRFGIKSVFFWGSVIFYVGTLLSGLSTNFWTYFCFRIIEGAGGGLIFPIAVGLINLSFSEKYKSLALSLYASLTFGIGATVGLLAGGLLTDLVNWRITFTYISYFSPIILILLWITINESEKTKPPPLDLLGALFYLLCIGSLVSWLGNVKLGWNTEGFLSPFSFFSISLALVSLICFILQSKRSQSPFLLLSLFKTQSFLIGSSALFIVGLTFFSTGGDFAQIMIENLFYQKSVAGITLMYFGISLGISGIIGGFLTVKIGIIPVILFGLALNAFSGFTSHSLTIQSDPGAWIQILLIKGAGIGFSLGPLTAFALSQVPPNLIPAAAALSTLLRQLGASIGSLFTGLIKELRIPFHLLRFGEQMSFQSPAYLRHSDLQGSFLVEQAGKSFAENHLVEPTSHAFVSELYSSALLKTFDSSSLIQEGNAFGNATEISSHQLMNNARFQANILSTLDAYWILSWLLILFIMWILYTHFWTRYKNKPRHQ